MKHVGLGFQCSEEGKDAGGFRAMACGDGNPFCFLLNIQNFTVSHFYICRKYLGLSPAEEMP